MSEFPVYQKLLHEILLELGILNGEMYNSMPAQMWRQQHNKNANVYLSSSLDQAD